MVVMYRVAILLVVVMLLVGCGPRIVYVVDGNQSARNAEAIDCCISWRNSVNGEIVLDVDGEHVSFKNNGHLCFERYECTGNYYVQGSALYLNGRLIGSVAKGAGDKGGEITVLKDKYGCLIDIEYENSEITHYFRSCLTR